MQCHNQLVGPGAERHGQARASALPGYDPDALARGCHHPTPPSPSHVHLAASAAQSASTPSYKPPPPPPPHGFDPDALAGRALLCTRTAGTSGYYQPLAAFHVMRCERPVPFCVVVLEATALAGPLLPCTPAARAAVRPRCCVPYNCGGCRCTRPRPPMRAHTLAAAPAIALHTCTPADRPFSTQSARH